MAKDKTGKEPIVMDESEQRKTLEDSMEAEESSYSWLSTVRNSWDDKESMLLGTKPTDALSKKASAKVFNPTLATMIIERSSRVMAQAPVGTAFAVSKDDVGKNMLMNLLLKYFTNHANEEGSLVLKFRQMNMYSHVYGTMFGLVPWRINRQNGYIGPELLPINMRDVRPQPGRRTIDKSDRFGIRSVVSLNWLQQQDKGAWMNIDKLATEMKAAKDGGESARTNSKDTKSFVERERYPSVGGDSGFPDIEIFTDYQHDKWVTWAPRFKDVDSSHPHILRVVKNPYIKGYLPVVGKHALPLLDSLIGLGDFERGKTLQFAMNSLINLYLDGVKYSIFPPLHINLDEVDPSSIVWQAGGKWFMQKPNESVQPMTMHSSEWLNTFQSTYGFLSSAIQNLSGSTSVAQPEGVEPGLGKTPSAIKQYGISQTARDEWDRFMMEETISQVYERWISLITNKLEVPITMRVFGPEVKDLKKQFPDENVLEIFKSGDRGNLKVDKSWLTDGNPEEDPNWEPTRYDFDLETGSTISKNTIDEGEAASSMIKDFIDAPALLQQVQRKGKDIDFAELYKRRMIGNGIKDWDKILTPGAPQPQQQMDESGNPIPQLDANGQPLPQEQTATGDQGGTLPGPQSPGQPPVQEPDPNAPPTVETPAPSAPVATPEGIKDPAIAQALSGINGGGQ